MLIGRLLALGISVFIIVALGEYYRTDGRQEELPWILLTIAILGLIALVVFVSFFKRHYRGTHRANPDKPEQLTHEDLSGLGPAFVVTPSNNGTTVADALNRAATSSQESILLKVAGKDSWKVGSLLILTNRRLLYYRTGSFGFTIFLNTIVNLIHKIPFGGLILWPFEGIADAWRRLRNSEYRNIVRIAKVRDEHLLAGKVPRWKLRHQFTLPIIRTEFSEISIKPRFWNPGLAIDFQPVKLAKVFRNTEFIDPNVEHFTVYACLAELMRPKLEALGLETLVEPNRKIVIKPRSTAAAS